ncbi:MAG: cytochrome c [Hyphomonas sp.]|uniref:c-type cytochrome n=1 Tax=Hyphomonas sp. TaxID=87 RepID=UPI0017AD5DE9|nr:cytochrome c [Hyphomonas sp.]MBU3922041.1 cytochrome c [Alphaproteobacteria bacterium]MBA3066933.1 cytochrome c [Hyphomonas sp.]MBU4060563.1 cytochrome c [Alphaproteobacteria bacterium]MBU4165831.1 cytochrome c [Alphaproteobacteria bacterium]MBU4569237.1 cytochrome c [Alphaproteobacteria bacterium]
MAGTDMTRAVHALLAAGLLLMAACAPPAPEKPANTGPPPMPIPETVSSRPSAGPGEKLFLEHCAACHGPVGMGTGLLARRTDQPLLEKREDLSTDYVETAVRLGIGNMPPVTRGELSDDGLRQIADYLAASEEIAP